MKWDIFGKKRIDELEKKISDLLTIVSDINKMLRNVKNDTNYNRTLLDNFKTIEEVKPRVRNEEDVWKEEQRQEKEAYNLYKN